jgi:protocatechuate 3,4-dioxygenase beta subunit
VPSLKARGEIVGHVLDERGEPIQYAAIILVGTRTGAMSGERGEFKLLGIAPGAYDINVMVDRRPNWPLLPSARRVGR